MFNAFWGNDVILYFKFRGGIRHQCKHFQTKDNQSGDVFGAGNRIDVSLRLCVGCHFLLGIFMGGGGVVWALHCITFYQSLL